MAAIRIQLPGRTEASVIALKGERITIGRSPANTIQILDRSMSSRHAELIQDGDHYRLHDLGSTNGVYVNGQQVTDYHLQEKCKLGFGNFACEFLPEVPAEQGAPVETLPTRAEVNKTQAENSELKLQLAKLREEMETLKKSAAAKDHKNISAVTNEQYEGAVAERESIRAELEKREGKLAQLQEDVTTARAARDHLQKALDAQKAAFEAAPKPADLELLRVENGLLKARLDAQALDLEKLRVVAAADATEATALRAEYKAQEVARDLSEAEIIKLKAELGSLRKENSELKTRVEDVSGELDGARNSHESLAQQAAGLINPEDHQRLTTELATSKTAQQRLEAEFAGLKKDLTKVSTDKESLQRVADAQRAELEAMPKPAELESLRAANAKLEESVRELSAAHESAKAAKQSLEAEVVSLRENLETVSSEKETLQRSSEKQQVELEAMPKPAEVETLRAANRNLEETIKESTSERALAVAAQQRLEQEIAELKKALASVSADKESLQQDSDKQRAELATMPKPSDVESLRIANADLKKTVEELTAAHMAARDAQRRLEGEVASVKKELATVAADRESLQHSSEKQRIELETMPKPAEVELLRAANAHLEGTVKKLSDELESLRTKQKALTSQSASKVPKADHEKLVAEHESLQRTQKQGEVELAEVSRQLAELKAQSEKLERMLQARDSEIDALRSRVEKEQPAPSEPLTPRQTRVPTPKEELPASTDPDAGSRQLEEALGKLGFVVRPVRRDVATPSKNGVNSTTGANGAHVDEKGSGASRDDTKDR